MPAFPLPENVSGSGNWLIIIGDKDKYFQIQPFYDILVTLMVLISFFKIALALLYNCYFILATTSLQCV